MEIYLYAKGRRHSVKLTLCGADFLAESHRPAGVGFNLREGEKLVVEVVGEQGLPCLNNLRKTHLLVLVGNQSRVC